jgi:flagellar basal-body rod protein FlgC
MSFWTSLKIGASGLYAQRLRLDTITNNVANAETTRTETGGAYQRKDVVFAAQNRVPFQTSLLLAKKNLAAGDLNLKGVQVASVVTDTTEGSRVYDPTHEDADENGYVEYPNVNLVVEMTNMLSATRSYEANLAVIQAARDMAQRALQIGQG